MTQDRFDPAKDAANREKHKLPLAFGDQIFEDDNHLIIPSIREIDGEERRVEATGDGPVDATFKAVRALFPHGATLQLYQVQAVTEGTDAQATVSVRLEEEGRISTGQAADTDTVVASARAYVNAINRLLVRREKTAPGADRKAVSYRDAG